MRPQRIAAEYRAVPREPPGGLPASMRPQRIAAEYRCPMARWYLSMNCFNEAAANRCGIPTGSTGSVPPSITLQ